MCNKISSRPWFVRLLVIIQGGTESKYLLIKSWKSCTFSSGCFPPFFFFFLLSHFVNTIVIGTFNKLTKACCVVLIRRKMSDYLMTCFNDVPDSDPANLHILGQSFWQECWHRWEGRLTPVLTGLKNSLLWTCSNLV